jgi:hypothetical protein
MHEHLVDHMYTYLMSRPKLSMCVKQQTKAFLMQVRLVKLLVGTMLCRTELCAEQSTRKNRACTLASILWLLTGTHDDQGHKLQITQNTSCPSLSNIARLLKIRTNKWQAKHNIKAMQMIALLRASWKQTTALNSNTPYNRMDTHAWHLGPTLSPQCPCVLFCPRPPVALQAPEDVRHYWCQRQGAALRYCRKWSKI